jgi:hypothetical protein
MVEPPFRRGRIPRGWLAAWTKNPISADATASDSPPAGHAAWQSLSPSLCAPPSRYLFLPLLAEWHTRPPLRLSSRGPAAGGVFGCFALLTGGRPLRVPARGLVRCKMLWHRGQRNSPHPVKSRGGAVGDRPGVCRAVWFAPHVASTLERLPPPRPVSPPGG